MKAVSLLVLFCLLAFSCSQDESKVIKTGIISFSLSPKAQTNGRVADTGTPAAVLLSIKDAAGNLVYENKKLSLFTFGQGYMSESVQMKVVGSATDYTLVTFLVLDSNGKTLYASPTAGSPKAQLVSKPLPLKFTISENDNVAIVPEVLAVDDTDTPESFGYASFGFEVVGGVIPVRQLVFSEQSGYMDTISFQYSAGKVISADWRILRTYPDMDAHGYHEQRTYNTNGQIIELKADNVWDISYTYLNGLPEKVITNKGWWGTPITYNNTRMFTEYLNGHPTKMKSAYYYPESYGLTSTLAYDTNGNVTGIETLDTADNMKYTISIAYAEDLNPIKDLVKSPMIQAYGYFNDWVFSYSRNLPQSIISTRYFENISYAETTTYSFSYTKNNAGKITTVEVRAKITDKLHVFYDDIAYKLSLSYQ